MPLILLSASGTLRLILILLVIYLVLRVIMRSRNNGKPPGGQWTNDASRPKGEVRIERPNDPRSRGNVEDADYEEIK
jgi:hypothetical protein